MQLTAYDQTIYKFAPDGTRTVFVGPSAFAEGESPVGLAFDSSGNLFVSIETFSDPGADSIVYFTPMGVKSHLRDRPNYLLGAWPLTARAISL